VTVEPAVRLRGVVKRFGELTAIDELELTIPPGICFGLLGPNGAGKSTLMRTLTGQAVPDVGAVEVLGMAMPHRSKEIRSRCGVVPQVDNLDDELTVGENLGVSARLYGIPRAQRPAAIARGLALATLEDRVDTIADELSGGMRRRLLIARGLMHRPELVLLDEPTVGLDPQVRQQLWSQIGAIRAEGATVVLTTHYIEEAERLADEVAIMHRGRIVAQGPPQELIARFVGTEVHEVWGDGPALIEVTRRAQDAGLVARDVGTSVAVLGVERLTADTEGGRIIDDLGPGRRRAATLEDVFVVLTGEAL
jgi:lipooligosaccharide transport system ATP-binding protein